MKSVFTSAGLLSVLGLFASPSQATIIDLEDYSATDGANFVQDLGTTISDDPAVYMVGTISWLPDALSNGFSSAQFWSAAGERSGIGKLFNSARVGISQNNFNAVAQEQGVDVEVDLTPGVTTTYQFVYKVDQVAGDVTLWVDPDLGMDEAGNTPNASVTGRSDQNDYTQVRMRSGFGASDLDFTDFAVYYGGDTPFSTAPPALPGDTDGDGDVDDSDLGTSFSNYTGPVGDVGKTAADGDNDGDGDVDDSDLGTSFSGYTGPIAVSVPEPTSLALLGLGGLLAVRRRRA